MFRSIILSVLVWNTFFLSAAQVGNENNLSGNTCDCSPSCSSLDNFNCKNGRISVRSDCPCCKVCLRQEGETCGDVDSPCDSKQGFACSPKGICEAVTKCKSDSDCPEDRFCVKDMCTDPCPLLQPCLGSLKGGVCVTRRHQPRCQCPKGTVENPELKSCLRFEGGFQPTTLSGQNEKILPKPGIIKVKSLTQNSTTLLLPSSLGGVLHYKESRTNVEALKKSVEDGQSETFVTGLEPNTKYTFKWAGAQGSTGKVEIKTEDGCMHDNTSHAIGSKWHEECLTTCMCHSGGISDCRPRCVFVSGAIQDDQCEEKPSASDPECCVEYDCKKKDNSVIDSSATVPETQNRSEVREPKLIVTARTHNSVTVAWDDFRAENPDRGYVTEYREVPDVEINAEIPWMKKETLRGQPPPTMTLGELKPNTLYEIRVGIYSQAEERSLIAATETITVRTEPGCVYGNTSFPVGVFFQGCEERCNCAKDGSVKCSGRCTIPYFKKGSFANDPLCTEEQEEGDDCCVLVMCAHGGSGGITDYDQCANTVCGKNAECVSWPTLNEASHNQDLPQPGSCKCKEGFSGDPTDHAIGCLPDPSKIDDSNNCMFRLTSYSPGDVFYDGCSYRCTCSHEREIECQPRCQFGLNETHPEDAGDSCSYLLDPNDECCKIRVCSSSSNSSLASVPTPSLDFDGCMYGNKTYAKDEEFVFGCDSKCLCMGFGDVSCSPRCPPIKEMPKKEGVICETLLDPEDQCCNVTVCDDMPQDVMKADVEGENVNVTLLADKNMADREMTFNSTNEKETVTPEIFNNINRIGNGDSEFGTESRTLGEIDAVNGTTEEKSLTNNSANITEEHSTENALNAIIFKEETKNEPDNLFNSENSSQSNILFEVNDDKQEGNVTNKNSQTPIVTNTSSTDMNMMDKEMDTETNISVSNNETSMTLAKKKPRFEDIMTTPIEIEKIVPQDSSVVQMTIKVTQDVLSQLLSSASEKLIVSYSPDSLNWNNYTVWANDFEVENMLEVSFLVPDLEAHDSYQFKVYYEDIVTPTTKASLIANSHISRSDAPAHEAMCAFEGKHYKPGEKFYDGCEQYCFCSEDVSVQCNKIECPAHSGLDIMDPGCIEWEDDPDYVPTPPRCCGQVPKCALHIDHLSCEHMGQKFSHLDFIPKEFVGCDQRCQCLSGNLDCESLCGPVEAIPPFHLPCHPQKARLITASSFPCCREWLCLNESLAEGEHPDGHTNIHVIDPPLPAEPDLSFVDVTDIAEDSARIIFTISQIFVGLPGGIYLRYTTDAAMNPNPLNWNSEVIHEDGVIMNRMDWEYLKRDLMPGSNYSMQLALFTHLKRAETVSSIFTVTTLPGATTTPLPRLDLDAKLSVDEIQNTSAKVQWKRFTEFELQYIDGIRVRFWPANKKFPMEGPMLHREANSMILRDLIPDTKYTVDLFFIPHEGLMTTISNTKNFTFKTEPKPMDKYAFDISIQLGKMKGESVQILYSGVPEPEGKYINVYRVVYTTDGDLHDSEKFRVPKNRKEGFISIASLKPGVVYEVWLEAYLTNGQKKKSNVITVRTQPGVLPKPEKSEIGEEKSADINNSSSYYSAFVAMVILVILACFIILGLVFIVFRRQNQAKGNINSKTASAAYDNPSYKASEHPSNYAMEMNGLRNASNGSSRPEEA